MRPNILLIVADTLRADRLSSYGYHKRTTPNLDTLARRGVRFAQAFSQANATEPSFTTLLSGMDPLSHGVVGHFGARGPTVDFTPLPGLLRNAGYRTAAVDNLGRWIRNGFDRYTTFFYEDSVPPPGTQLRTAEEVTDLAIASLTELADAEPYFLMVHYWDPHTPYLPPPPYDAALVDPSAYGAPSALDQVSFFPPLREYFQRWIPDGFTINDVLGQYDGEVAYLDEHIGRLLQFADTVSDPESTLTIFTSDHGEGLGEHGIFFAHYALYDQLIHVPLIFTWPGTLPPAREVDGLVRHIDVLPSLLGLLDLPRPDWVDGASVVKHMRDPNHGPVETPIVFSCEGTWQVKLSARTERWKLIHTPLPDYQDSPTYELYDLLDDPGESRNLAGTQLPIERELRNALTEWWSSRVDRHGGTDPLSSAPSMQLLQAVPRAVSRGDVIDMLVSQGAVESSEDDALSPEESELVEARLRALGYLGFKDEAELTPVERARTSVPMAVKEFPHDLANPSLTYFRVHEDGWVGRTCSFVLAQPDEEANLVVRGTVPVIDDPKFATQLRVLLEGKEVARRMLAVGPFQVWAAIPRNPGHHRVELHFSEIQKLAEPDGRSGAAVLRFIGFETAAERNDEPSESVRFKLQYALDEKEALIQVHAQEAEERLRLLHVAEVARLEMQQALNERLHFLEQAAEESAMLRDALVVVTAQLHQKDQAIHELTAASEVRGRLLEESVEESARLREALVVVTAQLHQKDQAILELTAASQERLQLVEQATAELARLRDPVGGLTDQLREKDQAITDLAAIAEERLQLIGQLDAEARRARADLERLIGEQRSEHDVTINRAEGRR
jgi:arylsulfatase A-like enzyme